MSVGSSRDLDEELRQAGGAMILWGGVRRLAFRLAPLAAALLLSGCDLGGARSERPDRRRPTRRF